MIYYSCLQPWELWFIDHVYIVYYNQSSLQDEPCVKYQALPFMAKAVFHSMSVQY